MKTNRGFLKGFSKSEKRIFGGALVIALVCLALFTSDNLFRWFVGNQTHQSTTEQIGTIDNLHQDVRFKSSRTFEWDQANLTQSVHLGDALYAGDKSNARITLGTGKSIELQPNSLIRFSEVDGQKLSDLQFGNFRVKIDGTMKVAIRGVATTIEGEGAEAELEISQTGPPQIKVVRGEITTHATNKTSAPRKKFVAKAAPAPMNLIETQPAPKQEPILSSPVPVELASLLNYRLKLYDLYSVAADHLIPNSHALPRAVQLAVKLAWETNFPTTVEFESATDSSFKTDLIHITTNKQIYSIENAFIGSNFWRVRSVNGPWSKTQSFEVATGLLSSVPQFSNPAYNLNLINGAAPFHLRWSADRDEFSKSWSGYVLEISTTQDFTEASVSRFWRKTADADFTFHSEGQRFVRVRAVNEKGEITGFSDVAVVSVVNPPLLEAPRLAQTAIELMPSGNSNVRLRWDTVASATHYAVELKSLNTLKTMQSSQPESSLLTFKELAPGQYSVKVASIDQFNRIGQYSTAQIIQVHPAPAPAPALAPQPAPQPTPLKSEPAPVTLELATREPASKDDNADSKFAIESDPLPNPSSSIQSRIKVDNLEQLNGSYKLSHLQIEGTNTVMVSNVEQALGRQAPLTGGIALRGINWFNQSNGAELALKTKVIGYNEAGKNSSPLSLEGRYARRWSLPWHWFSALRELQVSALAGLEAYRNSNSGQFATAYNAAKLGFGLEFPIARHWDTGGEALAGVTTDISKKYEFSGHLHYNFGKQVSFGLGYRVNVFEAGSNASSPVRGLPYREAYGEGYTVLRMAY